MTDSTPWLRTNAPRLETAVQEWLLESRMPLPTNLAITIELGDSVPAFQDSRTAYRQGFVEIRAGAPQGWAQVRWADRAVARVDATRPIADVFLTRDAAENLEPLLRGFLLVVLIFLWKREGLFHLHAGTARDPLGRGWMLTGNTHSGKSTTMALLARRGWEVGTDDAAFLSAQTGPVEVYGFRDLIALRPGGLDLIGCQGGTPLPGRGKTAFTVEELGGRWIQVVEPEIVLFAEGTGSRTTLTPTEPAEILHRLIQNSPWVLFEAAGAAEHLQLLARLGGRARCYKAVLGPDIFERPDGLMGLLP